MIVPPGMWEAALRALVIAVGVATISPSVRRVLIAWPWLWVAVGVVG